MTSNIGTETNSTGGAPLNNNRLYNPLKSPRLPGTELARWLFDPRRFDLPAATAAHRTCVAFLHHALLGTRDDLTAIATAVEKVVANIDRLRDGTDGGGNS